MFKKGDKVVCVDASNTGDPTLLVLNRIYEVLKSSDNYVHIDEHGGFRKTRFRKVILKILKELGD